MSTASKPCGDAPKRPARRGRARQTERGKALARLSREVASACKALDPVKRGFVETEFESYTWNCRRLDALEAMLGDADLAPDERKDLRTERHQLVTESGQLFSHLVRQLRDAAKPEDDPLGDFMAG